MLNFSRLSTVDIHSVFHCSFLVCFQYKKKCHKIMNNLKDKTQLLEAKTEELELEKLSLQ